MNRQKPFNDALKHQQIIGSGGGRMNYKRLPLGIRIIGYFIRLCILTAVVMLMINWVLSYL
jgi:hypothetical protein